MGNRIFEELLDEQIAIFRNSFSSVSRNAFFDEEKGHLIHSGEFGTYREAICRDFLRFLVPKKMDFDTGFVINTNNEVSTQLDIIIFDSASTPLIQSGARQRFFPVEALCAVGEVKSVVSKQALREALKKLSKVKVMREFVLQTDLMPHTNPPIIRRVHSGNFNPVLYPYDQVFTFLICEKFDFKTENLAQEMNSFYDADTPCRHFHNLVLSVEDGLICYYEKNGVAMMYPDMAGQSLKHRFIAPDNNPTAHFKFFASYLFMGTSSNTILHTDIANYIGGFIGGLNHDEQ